MATGGDDDYVALVARRNRGWPWPEDSWGLEAMFGSDGWCRSCGTPRREQTHDLVLQRRSFTPIGAWVPNWRFDVLCLDEALAMEARDQFDVSLRPVRAPKDASEVIAQQLMFTITGTTWFDPETVRANAMARHGSDGGACSACGTWRWLPLPWASLPAPSIRGSGGAAIASPEWFGDGTQSYRQVLVLRPLAELLTAADPREFTIHNVI